MPVILRPRRPQVLLAQPVHLTAKQVLHAARRSHPQLTRATVYNTLQHLPQHLQLVRLDVIVRVRQRAGPDPLAPQPATAWPTVEPPKS